MHSKATIGRRWVGIPFLCTHDVLLAARDGVTHSVMRPCTLLSKYIFQQRGARRGEKEQEQVSPSIMGAGGDDAKYILRDPAIERCVSCHDAFPHMVFLWLDGHHLRMGGK